MKEKRKKKNWRGKEGGEAGRGRRERNRRGNSEEQEKDEKEEQEKDRRCPFTCQTGLSTLTPHILPTPAPIPLTRPGFYPQQLNTQLFLPD